MSSIFNPWGALRRMTAARDAAEAKARDLEVALQTTTERMDRFSILAITRANEISRMQKIMKHCHYRDPETGRIGQKGVMPK